MDSVGGLKKFTEVVAAVFINAHGEFLLCQRPQNKVYGGFWEFPGGKVEGGESLFAALKREIAEELNLKIDAAVPWITREFHYPHASVRLHFWKVKKFSGELQKSKIEHADFFWQPLAAPLKVAPLLPANFAIIESLKIPEIAFITRAELEGAANALQSLKNALLKTPRVLIQIRDKNFPRRAEFAEKVAELAAQFPQSVVIVNDDLKLAQKIKARGIHFSSQTLQNLKSRPDFGGGSAHGDSTPRPRPESLCGESAPAHDDSAPRPFPDFSLCGASVHSADELKMACDLGLDYVFLSPIFPTQSHPNAAPLGESEFSKIAQNSPIPIFALGGVAFSDLENLQKLCAHGIALLRGY